MAQQVAAVRADHEGMRRRPAVLLAAAALAVALSGCADDDDVATPLPPGSASPGSSPSPVPTTSAAAPPTSPPNSPPAPSSGDPAEPGAGEEPPFPANTQEDGEDPAGGPLTLVDTRVAAQDGYDRVVFEFDGAADGQPGWTVGYTDAPSRQGSGDAVDLEGDSVLLVSLRGVGLPSDTGIDELPRTVLTGSGLGVVTEVDLGGQFEGQYEAFVGLTADPRPFRVFRLDDPARVVIDVQTP